MNPLCCQLSYDISLCSRSALSCSLSEHFVIFRLHAALDSDIISQEKNVSDAVSHVLRRFSPLI